VSRTPEWNWWNPWEFNTLGPAIDQDGDGATDIPLYMNIGGDIGHARLTVLYGSPGGGLPDTANFQTIALDSCGGVYSLLTDVTGDGSPELLCNCGLQEVIKIYAGREHQRIAEQFGSGHAAPMPGKGWWPRPWAELWTANHLNDGFNGSGFGEIMNFNDGNLDGINDIWLTSTPYVLCYGTGHYLDSLIDGFIELGDVGNYAYLGDIDGSGAATIALFSLHLSATVLFKASDQLPQNGVWRTLPGDIAGVGESSQRDSSFIGLQVAPNPSGREVTIRWRGSDAGEAGIRIRDILGREVANWSVPAGQHEAVWNNERMVGGAYFVTLTVASHTATTRVIVR
jgi:hypothetical protein